MNKAHQTALRACDSAIKRASNAETRVALREWKSRILLAAGRGVEGWRELMEAAAVSTRFLGDYAEGVEADYRGGGTEGRRAALFEEDATAAERVLLPLERFLLREPRRAEAWAWRGAIKRRLLDYAGAVSDLNRAEELGMRTATLLSWRGEAKFQIGEAEAGARDMEQAFTLDCQAWNYAWYGRIKLTVGKDASGLEALERAISLDPQNGWLYAWRGEAKRRLGRRYNPEEDFKTALTLDRSDRHRAMIYGWRGLYRSELSRDADALDDLNRCLRLLPEYPTALIGRAALHRRAGRLKLWIDDYTRACRLSPNLLQHLYRLETSELESYLSDLEALKRRRTTPAALRWAGFCLMRLGRHQEALADIRKALALDPRDADSIFWSAEILCDMGQPRAALRELNRGLKLEPQRAAAWALRARARMALGAFSRALADLDRSLLLDRSSAPVRVMRGSVQLMLDRPQKAAEDFRLALHYNKNDVQTLVDLSVACERGADAAGSREALAAAMRLDPSRAKARGQVWARHFAPEAG